MDNVNALGLTLLLLCAGCGAAAPNDAGLEPNETRVQLDGTWQSESCVPAQQADGSIIYLERRFVFDDARWQLQLTTHADPACSVGLLRVDVGGEYALEGHSQAVPEALAARFGRDALRVTPLAAGLVGVLTDARCGTSEWRLGQAQDTRDGCLFLPSLSKCPAEYDLVRKQDDRLWFGQRTGDLCTPEGRPGRLDPNAVVRR